MAAQYPADFLWGVATSAYQVEGGLNGPHQPRNNWADWETRGRVTPTGDACASWERWRDDLALAHALGVNALRMGLEWARLEPSPSDGLDPAALTRYVDIIATARTLGMRPVLTLHHFTHPEWLGPDAWLDPATPTRFGRYVAALIPALSRGLAERHSQPPVDLYVTINEPNALAFATYLFGVFPRGEARRGGKNLAAALCGLLLGHVEAYRAIHEAHAALGAPAPVVTFNNWACAAYPLDRGLVDLLRPHTRRCRGTWARRWRRALPWETPLERQLARSLGEVLADRRFTPLLDALGPDEDPLDALAIDFYGPFLSGYLSAVGPRVHPWQWPTYPERLPAFVRAYLAGHDDLPLHILENGIAVRETPNGQPARPDGQSRVAALEAVIGALDRCIRAGLPVASYFHWSLIDNYEWGSYAPRFGLHGVDRATPDLARRPTDAAGEPAADAYRRLINARRQP